MQEVQQIVVQLDAGRLGGVQGVQQGRREQGGRRQRRQIDEMHAMGEVVGLAARGLDGQPGLADAAGTEHGEQAAGRVGQPLGHLAQLSLAADEGRGVGRQMHGGREGAGGSMAWTDGARLAAISAGGAGSLCSRA